MIALSTRRRAAALLAAALATTLTVAGCGSADKDKGAGSNRGSAESFPVTIDTVYGEITLEEKPERIVALSGQYVDLLASIDVEPTAFAVSEPNLDNYPWLDGLATGTFDPDTLTAEYKTDLDVIANYDPDLILTNTFQVDEQLWEQLSKIAPTFAGIEEGNNDWQVLLDSVGKLTGNERAAADAEAAVDADFAEAAKQVPGVAGKTYNSVGFDGERFWFGNGSWMEGLGLVPADNQDNTMQGLGKNDISLENIEQLRGDVLGIFVWPVEAKEVLLGDPRFDKLPASMSDTVWFSDQATGNASNAPGPHSLAWRMDEAVKDLKESGLNTK